MRPQLAMAAVFVLVVGSSLLLVRAKPGTGVAPLRVTERGVPAPEMAADAPAATAAAAADPAPADDEQAGRRRDEAEENLEESKSKGEEADGSGAAGLLADARAARDSGGCAGAVAKYDQVGVAFPGTKESSSAMWEAAECYRSMGQDGKAMELWLALRADEGYRDKADAQIALTEGNPTQNQIGSAPGAGAGVASPSKAMAKPSPPAAPAPAEASPPGAADAPAAPDRAFEKAF